MNLRCLKLDYYNIYKEMSDTTIMDKEESVIEKEQTSVKELVSDFEQKLSGVIAVCRELKSCLKDLDKGHKSEVKDASKNRRNKNKTGEKRDPSGFNAKQPVPPEFCEQPWGCEQDQELPRTMLTKMVYDYVKEKKLQDPDDKRKIHPDAEIKKLFHLKDSDELHFNNFQTYMKRLYDRDFVAEEELVSASSESETDEKKPKKKTAAKKKKSTTASSTI